MNAYDSGYQAYKDGVDANPYVDESGEYADWYDGWLDAAGDFLMDGVYYQ